MLHFAKAMIILLYESPPPHYLQLNSEYSSSTKLENRSIVAKITVAVDDDAVAFVADDAVAIGDDAAVAADDDVVAVVAAGGEAVAAAGDEAVAANVVDAGN